MPSARPSAAVALLLPPLAALLAYRGVYGAGYIFDDECSIVHNVALRTGDWWGAAFGSYNSLSNRPLTCLSLSINLQSGSSPGAMHVVSLLLHAANSVLVARIALSITGKPGFAAAVATLWAVHPLGVDAVAYLTQRSMLLLGFFALLAFQALLRSHASDHPNRWRAVCAAATAMAFAAKEEGAALPILLVLADRAFGLPDWKSARARLPFYGALAATWLVLIAFVRLGPVNPTVGYETVPPATAWEWLLTQTQCVTHYLLAVFWPSELRGMYDFPVLRELRPALVPGILLLAGLVVTAWLFVRHPRRGFPGAVFFLLLAPTSSVFPVITEPCADRRMYLPLLAVLFPIATWARRRLGARGFAAAVGIAALLLARSTTRLVAVYRDEQAFVSHAYAKNDLTNRSFLSGRILAFMAKVEHERGHVDASHALAERAMECEAPGRSERLVQANVLQEQGRIAEAERAFRAIVRDYPDYPDAKGNLAALLHARATVLSEDAARPLLTEAERLARDGLTYAPFSPDLHNTLAVILSARRRPDESLPLLRRALELRPEFSEARRNLGIAHLLVGKPEQALAAWQPLRDAGVHDPALEQLVEAAERMVREGR